MGEGDGSPEKGGTERRLQGEGPMGEAIGSPQVADAQPMGASADPRSGRLMITPTLRIVEITNMMGGDVI